MDIYGGGPLGQRPRNNDKKTPMRYILGKWIGMLLAVGLLLPAFRCDARQASPARWHGFEQVRFRIDGRDAYYVKPAHPLPGRPWIWRAHFPDWHTAMDSLLLSRGFYVAYINTNDEYGAPRAMRSWDLFYRYLTRRISLAPKPALEAVSRGGLYAYAWAKRNPDKVSCIYAEAPVCDFRSWPGGHGQSPGDSACWAQLRKVYGLSEAEALAYGDQPLDGLGELAAWHVPIFHIISLQDKLVPPEENTFPLVQHYLRLGGPATVIPVNAGPQELEGHHFPITDPGCWADRIVQCAYPVQLPLPYTDYVKVRAGLGHVYRKAVAGDSVTVAYLGGSITHNPGWRNHVSRFLRERFPAAWFRFIAAGIPSLGSLPHAFRLQRDVLDSGQVDLLFVEAAVNDRGNGTDSLTQLRALEGIVRHARAANPAMDIVFMSFADPQKNADYDQGREPTEVANHERVAAYYGLPSINLAAEVHDKVAAGEFSWTDDFRNLHPSPFGQALYFATMKALLDSCFSLEGRPAAPALPPAMDRASLSAGAYLPVDQARIARGWRLVNNWQPADQAPTRPGFVHVPVLEATVPGATCSLSFQGDAVGIALVSGPDAGRLRYSIDGGPFRTLELYTPWSDQLHLPWYLLLGAGLKDGRHVLRLRLAEDKADKSQGHACRIVYFLVNRPLHSTTP